MMSRPLASWIWLGRGEMSGSGFESESPYQGKTDKW